VRIRPVAAHGASPFADGGYVIQPMCHWTIGDRHAGRWSVPAHVPCRARHAGGRAEHASIDTGKSPGITATRDNAKMFATRTAFRASDIVVRAAIVGLALATAYIHSTLGGLLFTLNAVGYVTAAVAMVVPLALAVRFRWVVRLGLMAYAMTTIIGWAIQGPYYSTAYIAKAIEIALIALVAIDFARLDGNPVDVVKRELAAFGAFLGGSRGSAGVGA
jgi:hypothetical protein